jgi:predicted permease
LKIASGNLQEALKDSGAGSGQGRKHERTRSVLVVTEVALACMLLVGAGLLLRSFLKVLDVDLGFDSQHTAAVPVDFTDDPALGNGNTKESAAAIVAARAAHFQQLLQRVGALPGVEAAGISDYLPMAGNRSWGLPWPRGVFAPESVKSVPGPLVYVVTPGYLRAMGTRLRGRDLSTSDRLNTQGVVVIGEGMGKFLASYAHWPENDPIGHVLDDGSKDGLLVVGVAEDVHAVSVEGENGWQIYYPYTQKSWGTPKLVVRTTLPPAQLATSVMSVLREANPKQTAAEFRPIKALVSHATSPRRFFMLLVGAFAGLGLLLAAIGIYGVISYSVTRQTQEIGIRMALGASMQEVQRQVLKGTLRLALIGIAIGGVASLALGRLIATLLFGTTPWDAVTYVGMAFVLLLVATVSGYIPARRASRISPLVALRAN